MSNEAKAIVDSRGQFEAAAKLQGLSVTRTSQALMFANGHRRAVGDYIALETLTAWWGWQASRQALEIKLPEPHWFGEVEIFSSDEVLGAIEAAGLQVKP